MTSQLPGVPRKAQRPPLDAEWRRFVAARRSEVQQSQSPATLLAGIRVHPSALRCHQSAFQDVVAAAQPQCCAEPVQPVSSSVEVQRSFGFDGPEPPASLNYRQPVQQRSRSSSVHVRSPHLPAVNISAFASLVILHLISVPSRSLFASAGWARFETLRVARAVTSPVDHRHRRLVLKLGGPAQRGADPAGG